MIPQNLVLLVLQISSSNPLQHSSCSGVLCFLWRFTICPILLHKQAIRLYLVAKSGNSHLCGHKKSKILYLYNIGLLYMHLDTILRDTLRSKPDNAYETVESHGQMQNYM